MRPLARAAGDINAVSNSGQTPLHLAATNPQAGRTINYLLRQVNIRKDIKNCSGETAKDIAIKNGPFAPYFETVKQKTAICDGEESVDDQSVVL